MECCMNCACQTSTYTWGDVVIALLITIGFMLLAGLVMGFIAWLLYKVMDDDVTFRRH